MSRRMGGCARNPRGPDVSLVSVWAVLTRRLVPLIAALWLAGCGASGPGGSSSRTAADPAAVASVPQTHPQVVEPSAGAQATATGGTPTGPTPVGDVNAHAPPLSEVRALLRQEVVAARVTSATYIDPLRYVSVWERTDQGVDAQLPVGAPILAPCRVKVLAIIPGWYAGQPLVYFELLDGPDAGKVQYVAEEITDVVPGGTILQQGQPIARYAASGTGIEYGWSTLNGVTLARATTGYEEGQATPAGQSMRDWLNGLGANAGSS
jgi:hypothetical protein